MREELRCLGISLGMPGVRLMELIMENRLNAEDLTDKQVREVLEAWDTRYYVPISMLKEATKVVGKFSKEELIEGKCTQEEYDRYYVIAIAQYIKNMK